MSTPTNFKPSQLSKCCKDKTVIPDCCNNVRTNPKDFLASQVKECCQEQYFNQLANDDAGRETCCELKPTLKDCPTPKRCQLG